MRKMTFTVPVRRHGKTVDLDVRTGFSVRLMVGGTRRRFMLQLDPMGRPTVLADYASGYRLVNLGPLTLYRYVRHPATYSPSLSTWRQEAQDWLDRLVAELGEAAVLAKLDAVPVLNNQLGGIPARVNA